MKIEKRVCSNLLSLIPHNKKDSTLKFDFNLFLV